MRLVKVTNTNRNTVVGDKIEVADTSFTRLFGLLGRRNLDTGRGLWIRPSSGVHTLGMFIPIDVIGLDKSLRVIRIWPNLVPWRLTSVSLKIQSVIELPAGRVQQCDTQVGDQLEIQNSPAEVLAR
jgi:uncharacterized membrane protein (UPF0127 family)